MGCTSSLHSNSFLFAIGAYFLLMLGFFIHSGYADYAVCFKVSRSVVRFLFRSGLDFGSDQRPDAREQVHL